MRCHECGGVLVDARVEFVIETSNYGKVVVTNVPGKVCQSCDKRLFSLDVADALDDMRSEIESGRLKPKQIQRPPELALAFA